ncbi:MAG: DUF255 domain-containing protein [Gammaproteobacteria bacterium]
MKHSTELKSRLAKALAEKGPQYRPRTRHLENGSPLYTNRLIFEDSPYLLQHAHNPVDWFPWGEEAFETARKQNKPVFLSIGYATCHWCHVMEEDSFENTDVAEVLNEYFVAVKVDREQHPDIDQTYMTAVQLITGQGGWPMSSFLTHEGKPFFGGTYYPSSTFTHLLLQIRQAWDEKHDELFVQAERIAEAVRSSASAKSAVESIEPSTLRSAVYRLMTTYDSANGGFSGAPKFPNEPLLLLLLHSLERSVDGEILSAVERTLSAMAQGGIYDQIGGGFHRYSTDPHWLVPHFEKMLYNQAYLARVYARAYRLTRNPLYARVVRQTLDYVLREMTTGTGVFYSATDADSEGHEGTYFIWTAEQIKNLLNPGDAGLMIDLFGVTPRGNFEGRNILFLPRPLPQVAEQLKVSLDELFFRIDPLIEKMRRERAKRIPPLTDDKIITAWNAMLIAALTEAGAMLDESRYIAAAERAAEALWQTQRTGKGELWRISLNGKSSIEARQDDYAHFIEALLALYDVKGDPALLNRAESLAEEMLDKFLDPDTGTLAMGKEKLLFTQPKESYDGALPSGNAVAIRVLSRLARRTGKTDYSDHAARILHGFSGGIVSHPEAYAYMTAQWDELRRGETGPLQYAAAGAVKVTASHSRESGRNRLCIEVEIADGWHIAAGASSEEVSAFRIGLDDDAGWVLSDPVYPAPVSKRLPFETEPRPYYQGRIAVHATLSPKDNATAAPVLIRMRLQACAPTACLPPEILDLTVFAPE